MLMCAKRGGMLGMPVHKVGDGSRLCTGTQGRDEPRLVVVVRMQLKWVGAVQLYVVDDIFLNTH